jgi:hypothetical protein
MPTGENSSNSSNDSYQGNTKTGRESKQESDAKR